MIPNWIRGYFQRKELKEIIRKSDAITDSPALTPIIAMASQGHLECERFEDLVGIFILYWVTRNEVMDKALRDWSQENKASSEERLKTWAMWQKFKAACEGTDDIDECFRRFKRSL